jgi:eukaryotic-like serine/threonine-protein kinase
MPPMQTIGRYKVLDTLGRGGMGVVYRAFDTLLERTVALKVIGTQIDSNPETRSRFLREARSAGQLSHRNIVTIYDLGEHDGHPFLAMEYLEGEDLQQRLSGQIRMSLARKVDLAIDICEGLEYAHAHGVVHRDVKPANVFITAAGQVKILDFGLARLVTSQLTNTHMLMGTLNYMAPEQVRGDRADHRADVFSAGVLFYELLGNKKAFEGDSFASTMYKILQEVPEPLCQVDATVPRDLANIVEHALAKPLDERYQSMTALREDLLLYRDQLRKSDSGATVSTVVRPDSSPDAVTMLVPASTPPGSGGIQRPSSGAASSGSGVSAAASNPGRRAWVVAGSVLAVAALATGWAVTHRPRSPSAPPVSVASAAVDTSGALALAEQALQAHDYSAAEQHARFVLEHAPSDATASHILERARTAGAAIESGLRAARTAQAAGDFQTASRAAGDVLTLAPGNTEAKQIMEQGAIRSGMRTAADARDRMIGAREQARASKAPDLAAPAYKAAVRAEQTAQHLLQTGRTSEATARFYVASGLYQSAATVAQARAERDAAAPTPAASAPPPVASPPETSRVEAPKVENARSVEPPPAPVVRAPQSDLPPPVAVTSPPPTPPATVPGATEASPRGADEAIGQLLARYKGALENKDIEALKKIWPSLTEASASAIRRDFDNASRLTVDVLDPRISASGSNGSVTFRRRYELQTRDGQRLRTETQTTMTVRRTPAGWIIDSVRFGAAR